MIRMSSVSPFGEVFRNSPYLLSEKFTESDAPTNCADYADSQSSHMQEKNEDCKPSQKRKQAPVHEEQSDSTDENDDSDSTVASACGKKKCRGKVIKLKDEKLDLQCEWQECDYRTSNLDHFVRHVSLHIPHLEVKVIENQEGVYACFWGPCGFKSADSSEIMRHVNFHSYHTKLKCIGSNILACSSLPVCTFGDAEKNMVPDLPHAFKCCWDTCEQTFNGSQTYFNHVETHIYCNRRGRKLEGGVHCRWRDCKSKSVYHSEYKLAEHIRSHTHEKLVGCPTCGGLFASRTKFCDHYKRQVSLELRGYQCLQCSKYYPSKNLLRDHMRNHVNYYKCSFCGKTCTRPSSLRVHIRYRHLNSKPFKCSTCEYRGKTHHDMKKHLNRHRSDLLYCCEEEGCGFLCRSAYGLRRHCDRCHLGREQPLYCCHICDSRFQRGSLLTRHLLAKHSICRPSGHCRFRYKCDEDGFFWLQTVHPETVEVTHKVMESQSGAIQPLYGSSHTMSGNENDPLTQEAGEDSMGHNSFPKMELDGSGNVECSGEMGTAELPVLPPAFVSVLHSGSEIE